VVISDKLKMWAQAVGMMLSLMVVMWAAHGLIVSVGSCHLEAVPSVTDADNRLCAPASSRSACLERLGYTWVRVPNEESK
jgi:hypothetical protein